MKRFLVFMPGLSAVFLAAVATAAGLVSLKQTLSRSWFKQGFYVGKLRRQAPTSSSTNKVTGSYGRSAVIDVASVTGGTCARTLP